MTRVQITLRDKEIKNFEIEKIQRK